MRKSPLDFFNSLHNASLFCPRIGPKSCRCAAQTPADTGFLQAFDPIRGGSRPLVLPLQKRTLFLQAGFFDKLRKAAACYGRRFPVNERKERENHVSVANKHRCLVSSIYREAEKKSTAFPEPSQFVYNRLDFVHALLKFCRFVTLLFLFPEWNAV